MTSTPRNPATSRQVTGIADVLRTAGFPIVVTEARRPGRRQMRPDVVAYESIDGELRAQVVVEVKSPPQLPWSHTAALAQLAFAREILGTSRHYVVIGGEWWRANDALTELHATQPPTPLYPTPASVRLADRHLIDRLVGQRLHGIRHELAQSANDAAGLSVVAALAQSVATTPLSIGDGLEVVVDRHVLASSIVQTIGEIVDRDRRGLAEFASPPPIADVVVRLLGGLRNGSAIDPFCGLGSFLWALGERAERQSRHLRLAGADINRDAVTVARSVADLLGINIEFVMADTLADPPTGNAYDYVVTAPPWGSRDEPVDTPLLQAPGARRRMELLAIARAYELLAPGGRAVLHLPASVLSSSFSRGLREFLAEQCSVLAIVSLPSRAFQAAATDSVLLVFDRSPAPPGHQTFIAHLGDDWDSQLAADGDTMQAYEQYLRNRGS